MVTFFCRLSPFGVGHGSLADFADRVWALISLLRKGRCWPIGFNGLRPHLLRKVLVLHRNASGFVHLAFWEIGYRSMFWWWSFRVGFLFSVLDVAWCWRGSLFCFVASGSVSWEKGELECPRLRISKKDSNHFSRGCQYSRTLDGQCCTLLVITQFWWPYYFLYSTRETSVTGMTHSPSHIMIFL